MNTETCDILVIGGGPAGSAAGTYLARLGYKVILVERDRFPRHHVGESLLPSLMPVLDDFGLIDKCKEFGFPNKTGATFVWGKSAEPWDIQFSTNAFLPSTTAFHVERALFDKMLLDNASESGVDVRQGVAVTDVLIEDDRVTGAVCQNGDGEEYRIDARMTVDASGGASVVGRRVTTRRYDDQMRQVAFYNYFKNVRGLQGHREANIFIESCPRGWFWYIPQNSETLGQASVGLVTGQEFKEEFRAIGKEEFFNRALAEAPQTSAALGPNAERVSETRSILDWAYWCDRVAGPGFYLCGDAAVFLDPLLSTGVSLAMLSGFTSSACIHTSFTKPEYTERATAWYNRNYLHMFEVTRDFLHYFYAANASSFSEEDMFWQSRRMLNADDNIGARQAFTFLINTIPGNPHPAMNRQIQLFREFMGRVDHESVQDIDESRSQVAASGIQEVEQVEDETVLVVNGDFGDSFEVDKESHTLRPIKGIAYDRNRAVLSRTSAWLLGQNFYAVSDEEASVLALLDSSRSWGQVIAEHARQQGLSEDAARGALQPVLDSLLRQRLVLSRVAAASA